MYEPTWPSGKVLIVIILLLLLLLFSLCYYYIIIIIIIIIESCGDRLKLNACTLALSDLGTVLRDCGAGNGRGFRELLPLPLCACHCRNCRPGSGSSAANQRPPVSHVE